MRWMTYYFISIPEPEARPSMQHCPTCNALLKDAPVCRRCKTDLTRVLQSLSDADKHYKTALQAHANGRLEEMLRHARRCFSLRRTIASGRLLACAALLNGDYRLAIKTWTYIAGRNTQ
jgi:hypothetical protein